MSSQPVAFDPSTLASLAEQFDPSQVVETSDFTDDVLIPVGRYITISRELVDVKNDKGTAKITLALSGGFTSESGSTFGGGKFPLRSWINSNLFQYAGQQGQTSSLAQYLKAAGIETAGKTIPEMVSLLPETLTTPMYVRIGRQDKAVKQDDGTYKYANLKTRDFEIGKDPVTGEKVYGATAVKDGVTHQGKAKVEGFSRIK